MATFSLSGSRWSLPSGFWGALGDIGSAGVSFLGSSHSAKKNFKYQSQLIKMQQDWMERMSNTAHQREVADLREAGLNPILSATGGSGASTPGPGGSSFMAPDAVNTALQSYLQRKQQRIEQQNANSQSAVANSTVLTNREQQEYLKAQAKVQEATAKQIDEMTKWIGPQATANMFNLYSQGYSAKTNADTTKKTTPRKRGINLLGLDVGWNEYDDESNNDNKLKDYRQFSGSRGYNNRYLGH